MTLTTANVPTPPVVAQPTNPPPAQPQAVPIPGDEIVAKPLVDADFTDITKHLNNSALACRWVNRSAGSGARYDAMKAQGFRNAVLTDFKKDTIAPHFQRDGAIIYGDLIAMVIAKKDYLGALKNNEQKAIARLSRENDVAVGRTKMAEAMAEVSGTKADKAKVQVYKPSI